MRKATGMDSSPRLMVEQMSGSHDVYRIIDKKSHMSVILKSYSGSSGHEHNGKDEYKRLQRVRHTCGDRPYYETIEPIGTGDHGSFLLERYVTGEKFGRSIVRAFRHGEEGALYEKLTVIAGYLGDLHRIGVTTRQVNTDSSFKEINKHASQAALTGAVDAGQVLPLASEWKDAIDASAPKKCLTHGDVTPANFIFNGKKMYAIDLERSAYRDPAHDTGMLAGELFHYALSLTGNAYNADRFIGHFYWTYAGNFERQQDKFTEMTGRNPFYMANSLLRICRNPYIGQSHKKALGYYALECLKSLPRYRDVH